ncbi:MAG: hypothetical protein WDM77_02515 [Steroidobacteraceae bacterium]
MNRKLAIMTGVGLAAGLVSGCGGGDHGQAATGGSSTPPPSSVSLSTLDVLSLAEKPSDTSSPTVVNNGAVVLSDTSETSPPVSINGM